jgi:uncharacterized membrane protein YGL010W
MHFSPYLTFDTLQQLAFYGAYHSHPINILIHIICVPFIMWYVDNDALKLNGISHLSIGPFRY